MCTDFESSVRDLLFSITPEREDELGELLSGVTFQQDDSTEGIDFSAISEWKFVRIPMRCQFRLWVHCFTYFAAFAEFVAKRDGQSSGVRFGLSSQDLEVSGQLLEWAVTTDVGLLESNRNDSGFEVPVPPERMRQLFENQGEFKLSGALDEVFRTAVAFAIHHELAHVNLEHNGTESEQSIEEEYEADAVAADWILNVGFSSDLLYMTRHLGVAIALIWFVSSYFRVRNESQTHPPAWDRLLRAVRPTVRGDDDALWGFIQIALSLHFYRHGLLLDDIEDFGPTERTVSAMIAKLDSFNQELD